MKISFSTAVSKLHEVFKVSPLHYSTVFFFLNMFCERNLPDVQNDWLKGSNCEFGVDLLCFLFTNSLDAEFELQMENVCLVFLYIYFGEYLPSSRWTSPFSNETPRLFVLMDVSTQKQISFSTMWFTSYNCSPPFKSFATSSSSDFWNQTCCPKAFSIASNAFNRTESLWAAVFSPLFTVAGCLWGVCWIMEGISVGFQKNKDCFFFKHWGALLLHQPIAKPADLTYP